MVRTFRGISSSAESLAAINHALKKAASIDLLVKFSSKEDWEHYDLWMVPGWGQKDMYQKASAKLEQLKLTKVVGEFEEARFGKVTLL